MHIAQVAPLYESVPPDGYGGTERVVSYLTEELVRQGHDVTLFASGDSTTQARLVPVCSQALRPDPDVVDHLAPHVMLLERLYRQASAFDIIHFHIDYLHFPVSRRQAVPQLTTLHGRLDIPELRPLYREFQDMPLVSISDAQRTPLGGADWQSTVYHGLPTDLYPFRPQEGEYFAFLGRISPEKRVDRAIEIARRTDTPLKIAAKVDPVDAQYFKSEIEPMLAAPQVEFIGEIGDDRKAELLRRARALLFPIDWPEPFGLVMIEAMACGTPVVAWRNGSVPEVVESGCTGFIVDTLDDAVHAVRRIDTIRRRCCRERFEQRFSVERMAQDYLGVYERLVGRVDRPTSPRDRIRTRTEWRHASPDQSD
jgi:glycosyltransferase involved in cell wall biosynthesis